MHSHSKPRDISEEKASVNPNLYFIKLHLRDTRQFSDLGKIREGSDLTRKRLPRAPS